MKIILASAALCLAPVINSLAGTETSTEFSFGYAYNTGDTWSLVSTPRPVVPQGDFSFTPSVTAGLFSEWGPTFANGTLENGTQGGTTGNSARTTDFAVTIDAAYTGAGTVSEITLEITQIRIHAASYTTLQGDNQIQWLETTPGAPASSPAVDLQVAGNLPALTLAATYTDVTWKPEDLTTSGSATTRSFALAADHARAIDGLEVTGVVKVTLEGGEIIVSNEFRYEFDYNANGNWAVIVATLPPTTVGDFTFTPTLAQHPMFSARGPDFVGTANGPKLFNGANLRRAGRSNDFAVSIDAAYHGSRPASDIKLEITGIRIHASSFATLQGDNRIQWIETTPGVTAASPFFDLPVAANTAALDLAASYVQVGWAPDDFAIPGSAMTRSFALAADNARAIEGFEVFGRIIVTVDSLALGIERNGDALDFRWDSSSNRQYVLASSTDLTTPTTSWPPYHDGITTFENILGTGEEMILAGVPLDGPKRFFVLREEPLPPLLAESFEAGVLPDAWTVSDNANGTAWEFGDPDQVTGPATGPNGGSGGPGSSCAGTNILANYTPDASASLKTPPLAIPEDGASLNFRQWIDTESDNPLVSGDYGTINVLDESDNLLVQLNEEKIVGVTTAWEAAPTYSLADFAGQTIRLEFLFTSNATNNWSGWYIDEVTVIAD